MADLDLSHTADIIKAAIPFVDTRLQGIAEIGSKMLDVMGSLKSMGKGVKMVSMRSEGIKMDIEGLLKGIRPICNVREQEIVDRILNIFNMKRMFEMYNNMMSAMKTMQESGGFNFDMSGSDSDAENVTGNFSGANFESIFQSFNNTGSSETPKEESDQHDDSETGTAPSHDSGSTGSKLNPMFDMLKTMVPPEQMSTFENLSMLFNTMSYDNNSKPDTNKEQSDG